MALAYLLDPCLQHQNRAGVNNVSGYFEVFEYDTDDRATVYTDFEGTLAPEHIGIDNNGRCVMIVDSAKAYRVEMHLPNGGLVYAQSPVWTVVSGGGVISNKVEVESSDGSISVDKTVVGNVTTYDLSANVEDGTDLLEWIRCDGGVAQSGSDIVKPTYSAGTMLVGTTGVQVKANAYYHVTAHLRATKSDVDAYYDNVYVLFSLGNEPVTRQSVIIDYSMGLSQDFEVSTDVKVDADSELNLSVIGASNAGDVELLNMEMHRIYSGTPVIPGGVQRTLIAGANITIEHTGAGDVISSTGGGGSAPSVQYIQEAYAEGYIATSGTTTLSFTRLSDSWDTYIDPTCAYLLRVTLGGESQSGLGELVYGSNPSISLEKWEYVDNYQDTYVSSAIPQMSGMDVSPCPRLNLNVSFLGEPSNRVYIVKPSEPLPEPPYVGGGQFLQLKLRDVTCDVAATLKMKAELFKITPTQYVWRYPWQY